jgi:O-antigen ligase
MTTNKWLKYFICAGIFIVPFIPWIVASSSYFPFITGKNFAFRVIVEIIFALWAILALRDKKSRPEKSWILYAVLALGAIGILATFFGLNPYRSFWSNYERMDGLINILHLIAYFVVLISVLKDKVKWFWLANTALVANFYIAIYSLLQLAGKAAVHQSATRLDASLGNSAYLAVYVLFMIFISVYLLALVWPKNKILAFGYGTLAVIDVVILYYTATRGAILGFVGGIILICLLLAILKSGKLRNISATLVVASLLLIGGFIAVKNTDFVQSSPVLSRFASISLSETTVGSRMMIWNMSLQGFKERPILGWGPENYSLVFSKYYDPGMYGQEPWFDRSHNIFFDWLINAGILGLLAYLSIYLSTLYYLWFGKKRDEKDFTTSVVASSLLTGLFAAYFFHNIFVFDNLISYILFFSLIAFIHSSSVVKEKEGEKEFAVKKDYQAKKNNSNQQIDLVPTFGAIVIIIVLSSSLYFVNYRPYKTSTDIIKAIHPSVTNAEEGLRLFEKVFSVQTFGLGESREQLIVKTMNLINDPNVSDETKTAFVKLVDEQIKAHQVHYAEDARSNLLFGNFFLAVGQIDTSLSFLQKAISLAPNKQQVLFGLVSTYVAKQDAPNALNYAKLAFDLDPNYNEARKIYALVSLMTNQSDLAKDLLAPIKESADYYNDNRFINLYEQNGDKASLQEINLLREKNK